MTSRVEDGEGPCCALEDPVFAMAESYFLDGGNRLVKFVKRSLTPVSEERSVAALPANVSDVGRCLSE